MSGGVKRGEPLRGDGVVVRVELDAEIMAAEQLRGGKHASATRKGVDQII